jgi:hypothetical protein
MAPGTLSNPKREYARYGDMRPFRFPDPALLLSRTPLTQDRSHPYFRVVVFLLLWESIFSFLQDTLFSRLSPGSGRISGPTAPIMGTGTHPRRKRRPLPPSGPASAGMGRVGRVEGQCARTVRLKAQAVRPPPANPPVSGGNCERSE